jgi:hypothetical protein
MQGGQSFDVKVNMVRLMSGEIMPLDLAPDDMASLIPVMLPSLVSMKYNVE